MRFLAAVALLSLGLAHAQPANTDANTLDPATQARLRMDGFAGGTGARIPPEANGGATVGEGQPNRHRVTKPVDLNELRARVQVGVRVVSLQARLAEKVAELQSSLDNVRQLRGLLPICAYCKRIRDDHNYWQRVEVYVSEHTDATFTHGICPSCLEDAKAELNP